MKTTATGECELCGLPLRQGTSTADFDGRRLDFCCTGCRMVYAMLMEASESPDPARFRDSDLYRRCVDAGVVPASEADLNRLAGQPSDRRAPPSDDAQNEILSLRYMVSGMWCPACAWVIETALAQVEGVDHAACEYATDRLYCRYNPQVTDPATLQRLVKRLGYSLSTADDGADDAVRRKAFVRLMVCLFLSANVMMLSWSLYSGFFTSLSSRDIRYISWPILVFATVVMGYGGSPLLQKAWWGVRAKSPGMEALVCLGAGSAYLYSLYNFLFGSLHLYFDTAAMLITLVLLGKMLESRAKRDVSRDLAGFLALQPKKVRLCSPRWPRGRFVDISHLSPGDHFRVLENEVVPADGRAVSGSGTVDVSAVTGESRPQAVNPGHGMTSGTRLISGDVTIETSRVGADALLGQMIDIIERSLAGRTPLESRTDRWLTFFVPLIAGLGLGTVVVGHGLGLSWEQAFVRGLTVLVIACPCALGIAIPLARVAGMAEAGRNGILVRDFEAFERATAVDTIVMDKTGTVTQGHWSLLDVKPLGDRSAERVLALAAGLERDVDHAVARAIAAGAGDRGIPAATVERRRIEGTGVTGIWRGDALRIGSRAFALSGPQAETHGMVDPDGRSRIYLSANGAALAIFEFGDSLRPGGADTVATLADFGFDIHLISGDGHDTTQAVARELGIHHARGGLLPADKADYVARLQDAGAAVAMIGDGINDAPALAAAGFSAAVHRHASLTRQAAAITLMRSNPCQLIDFFRLARRVNAKVVQNLGCAWVYNMLSIPIAMSGWLNPLVAAAAMLLSSLTVIGNTMLLVRRQQVHQHRSPDRERSML